MYPAQAEAKKPPQGRYHFEGFAATEPRFGFDAYCNMQLLFVHEPVASGAVMWFGQYSDESVELDILRPFSVPDFSACAASGALAVDAGLLFTDVHYRAWSTPLKPTWRTLWLDVARHNFHKNWIPLSETVTVLPNYDVLPTISLTSPAPPPPLAAGTPAVTAIDIATPYSEVVADLKRSGPWSSLKKLAKFLGTSHTQLGRILKEDVVPNDELAPRIDELHRFNQRLARLTQGDATVTKRLLTTPRERDNLSANDFLEQCDYRNAFRAVMEAASPRSQLAPVQVVPRRWYDEPSRDLHDDEVEPED
jgi:hypothetical protein